MSMGIIMVGIIDLVVIGMGRLAGWWLEGLRDLEIERVIIYTFVPLYILTYVYT